MNMQSRFEQKIETEAGKTAGEIVFRPLAAADVRAAMRLKEQAGWNQTENDWLRLIGLEPDGCFAAFTGEKMIGTITTTTYGAALAWIGMVLVDRDFRRRGIATLLMNRALAYLSKREIRTVKLDATPEGAFVYENLGFSAEATIERWSLAAAVPKETIVTNAAGAAEIFEFDRRKFEADRTRLLKNLIAAGNFPPLAIFDEEKNLRGYALVRRGAGANYLGPIVAESARAAENLLDAALSKLPGEPLFIDVNAAIGEFGQLLTARGFVKQRELTRMRLGEDTRAATNEAIFAIAGLEIG